MGSFSWAKLKHQQSEQHHIHFESLGTSWFTWPFRKVVIKALTGVHFFYSREDQWKGNQGSILRKPQREHLYIDIDVSSCQGASLQSHRAFVWELICGLCISLAVDAALAFCLSYKGLSSALLVISIATQLPVLSGPDANGIHQPLYGRRTHHILPGQHPAWRHCQLSGLTTEPCLHSWDGCTGFWWTAGSACSKVTYSLCCSFGLMIRRWFTACLFPPPVTHGSVFLTH